jgi:hypothetical protein
MRAAVKRMSLLVSFCNFHSPHDSLGQGEVIWRASHEGRDTHHINSLALIGGRLCLTAFGPKRGALWSTAVDGYVFDVERQDVLATGLEHPHSLHEAGSDVYVAESRRARVLCLTNGVTYDIGGYARGLCVDSGTMIVGVSTARSRSKSTGVVENPADPGEVVGQAGLRAVPLQRRSPNAPDVDLSSYGPEIYDVVSPLVLTA